MDNLEEAKQKLNKMEKNLKNLKNIVKDQIISLSDNNPDFLRGANIPEPDWYTVKIPNADIGIFFYNMGDRFIFDWKRVQQIFENKNFIKIIYIIIDNFDVVDIAFDNQNYKTEFVVLNESCINNFSIQPYLEK